MSVQMAKVRFHVPKVVARIYDPNRAYAYAELGIDTICTTCIGAGLMRDMILGNQFGAVADYLHGGLVRTTEEDDNA
jgi:trk system potassium uptake protein TrkA